MDCPAQRGRITLRLQLDSARRIATQHREHAQHQYVRTARLEVGHAAVDEHRLRLEKVMVTEDRKTLEAILERGFERMDNRFDTLADQIHAHGTRLALIEKDCVNHAKNDDRRDRRISSLQQVVKAEDISQAGRIPASAFDVLALLDKRDEARDAAAMKRDELRDVVAARRWRRWGALAFSALSIIGGSSVWKSCNTDAAVAMLARRPPTTIVTALPLPVVIKPDK